MLLEVLHLTYHSSITIQFLVRGTAPYGEVLRSSGRYSHGLIETRAEVLNRMTTSADSRRQSPSLARVRDTTVHTRNFKTELLLLMVWDRRFLASSTRLYASLIRAHLPKHLL